MASIESLKRKYADGWRPAPLGIRSIHWPMIRRALMHPTREVIIDDHRRWRWIDLIGGALHLAREIRKLTDQQHVGLILPTSGLFPMGFLACWMLGRIPVPLNYLMRQHELDYIVADSRIDAIVTVRQMLDVLEVEPHGVKLLELDKVRERFQGIPPIRWPKLARGHDTAVLLYTSGTSGNPKGVPLTHDNLASNVVASIMHANLADSAGFLGVLPQFHSFGLTALTLLPLCAGIRVIYTARFQPRKVVELVREHKPDVFMGIPSMYKALLSVKSATAEDLASLKFPVSGGEPLPVPLVEAFAERFDITILEGYGLTETSPTVAWSLPEDRKPGTAGKVLPFQEVQIVDDHGHVQPRGGEGEIWLRGPGVMHGYFNQPELSRQVLTADGWFKTGDWGRYDEQGYLAITGRIKEMLIIGGENVFPREIEQVLDDHPSVAASAVVGKQDDSRGEVAVAFVELREDEHFDAKALKIFCRDRLPTFKVPREIHCLDALPRSGTGKILRRKVRELLAESPDAKQVAG